jgi:hypothetical protein
MGKNYPELYKAWLFADNYIHAADSLLKEGYQPLSELELASDGTVAKELMLLTYALQQIEELKGIDEIHDVESAFWFFVEEVSEGDMGLVGEEFPLESNSRITASFRKLSEYNSEAESIFDRAAHEFYYGRHKYNDGPIFIKAR